MSTACPRCSAELPELPPGRQPEYCSACGTRVSISGGELDATLLSDAADEGPTLYESTPSRPASRPESLAGHGRFEPGERVGDRYRIVALLGKGGMGEVYRADDLELGISVALKLLPEELANDPAALDRLRAEVRTARQVAHPNVCRIYDLGQADGLVFLTMEYLDGEDLVATLRRLGRPTQEKALELARQLCAGLAATHEQGVLHGDLKPANIMIDGRGRVRIADFGLARTADAVHKEGIIVGTPAYMAPEQLEGKPADVRTDIFALGLVLYELFTGHRPYEASQFHELRAQHSSGTITSPGRFVEQLDPAVERAIMRCLEGDPESRPRSVYEVMAGLPGADPLAVALAAGETPSPEMVANAGASKGMRPVRAVGLMVATAVVMVTFGLIRTQQVAWPSVPPDRLTVLADLMMDRLGYQDRPARQVAGYESNRRQLRWIAEEDRSSTRWDRLDKDAPGWYFWKRWSPIELRSQRFHTPILWLNNPPPVLAGSLSLALSEQGTLLSFVAIFPPRLEGEAVVPLDWDLVFETTGLDPSAYREVPPTRSPPVLYDRVRSWLPTGPTGTSDRSLHAASFRGRLVYVSLEGPWGPVVLGHPLEASTAQQKVGLYGPIVDIVIVLMFLAAGALAWRNLAAGRGDRRGAFRLGVFILVVNLGESLLGTHLEQTWLGSVLMEITLGPALAHALLHAVQASVLYLAIEPYARKVWPHSLVSWMRLIKGQFRDPLVGRDVLVGGVCAASAALGFGLMLALLPRLGLPEPPPVVARDSMVALRGIKFALYLYFFVVSNAMIYCFGMVVMLLLARRVLRSTWLAAPFAAFPPFMFLFWLTEYIPIWILLVFALWYGSVAVFAFVRCGLLAMFITNYVFFLSFTFPPNLNGEAWFAYIPILLSSIGFLLGVLAIRAATSGQKWFQNDMDPL